MKDLVNRRTLTLIVIILLAASLRLVPHIPNVTPIAAMALFGGVHFSRRRIALLVPLASMALSDLLLGVFIYKTGWWHNGMPFVYAALAFTVWLGGRIKKDPTTGRIAKSALAGSTAFFLLTNFGVWLTGSLYAKSLAGLAACYLAAIPFFQNTLLGDAFFTLALFGGFSLAARRWKVLRSHPA